MDLPTMTENPEAAAVAPRAKTIRLALAVTWTLVICILCWMPRFLVQEVEGDSPWFQIPDLDKVIHWGIFFLFTVLWLRTGASKWRYAWVALAGLALAAITEIGQTLPAVGRDGEIGDGITDMIGVAIGLAVAPWIEPLWRWAESRVFRTPLA